MNKYTKNRLHFCLVYSIILLLTCTILNCFTSDSRIKNNDIETPNTTLVIATEEDTPGIGNTIVYVTKYGKKYHKIDCQYLYSSCIEIELADAIERGYTPCSKCNPPEK